jgi:hypothetical protein
MQLLAASRACAVSQLISQQAFALSRAALEDLRTPSGTEFDGGKLEPSSHRACECR